ncbi:MAG: pyridoxal phosphate-dependent decarboxylase family protein [Gammaproteobacteria bacterium]
MDATEDEILAAARARLAAAFAELPAAAAPFDARRVEPVLLDVAERLGDNFPYQHPLYVGQMLKPPHPLARLAYALAMELNPNNHALDGGRASSAMEKEAVAALARMIGFETHLGHLTGGGTMANLEALWIARELAGGGRVLASREAHYTHARMSALLGMEFVAVAVDRYGCMDVAALAAELDRGNVACVVATLGTTSQGALDPLEKILPLTHAAGVRVHVDAAYGGYFKLAAAGNSARERAFAVMAQADSVVIDPHKHGLQPYGCGAVLFRDPSVGRVYRHDSPYTYFSSDELHLGEISLECSRPGAAAVALWATLKLLPLEPGGEFASGLADSLAAARELHVWVEAAAEFVALAPPMLDIVVFGAQATRASAASRRARAVFEAAAERNLHLALLHLPRALAEPWWPDLEWDAESVTVLRSCLMKPEHLAWLPRITALLAQAGSATH